MAHTFDGGHIERVKDLPGPLQSGWNPGTWALPGTTLSWASLAVLVVVFGFPQLFETSRSLFRLPIPAAALDMMAAAVAWTVTIRCRNRPGRHFPRYWSLLLSALATIAGVAGFLIRDVGGSPWFHALSLALLTSSLTLTPRFFKLHPDRWLVQHVATLGLAVVLFVGLPLSYVFGHQAVEDHKRRVTETIAELSREAEEIRKISAHDWPQGSQGQEAIQEMRRLEDLPLEQWAPDAYLLKGAAVLGQEDALVRAYQNLLDNVVAAIDPDQAPKLWQPQYRAGSHWEKDPAFPDLSAAVASYHYRNGQFLRELAPPAGDSETLRGLASYYQKKRQEADEHLAVFSRSWGGEWVPPLITSSAPAVSPLPDLLRKPIADNGMRPGSLGRLLALNLDRAQYVAWAPGCGRRERYWEKSKTSEGSQPGSEIEYFRIDCYAYSARLDPEHPGADLRAELRLVYSSEPAKPLSFKVLPAELYLVFPVPAGTTLDPYREEVMQAFLSAVREEHPDSSIRLSDRSGSPAKGFFFENRGRRLQVSSSVENLGSGVQGIQVRALYNGRSL